MSELASNSATPLPRDPVDRPPSRRVLLTVAETARLLGVGRTTIYRLLRNQELESVYIGSLRRVPAESVSRLVARLRDTGEAARTDA